MTTRNRLETRTSGGSRARRRRIVLVVAAAITVVLVAAAFWASWRTPTAYALAPESVLPPTVRAAPPKVREAYRFAVANRETLRWIPCFCGCGAEGHRSNADCYVRDLLPDGSVVFDYMSLG